MAQTVISQEIARIIDRTLDSCYADPHCPRRVSLRVLRMAAGIPCTAEGMAQARREALRIMELRKASDRVTWYQVTRLVEGGPEWIRFTIPPAYARNSDVPEAAAHAE